VLAQNYNAIAVSNFVSCPLQLTNLAGHSSVNKFGYVITPTASLHISSAKDTVCYQCYPDSDLADFILTPKRFHLDRI